MSEVKLNRKIDKIRDSERIQETINELKKKKGKENAN